MFQYFAGLWIFSRFLFEKTTMFQYFAGLGIFSQFLSKKRLCSLLDFEYSCDFSQKNDYVPIFCWTSNIFTFIWENNYVPMFCWLEYFHIFIWENDHVPMFCWTWTIFPISVGKMTKSSKILEHSHFFKGNRKNILSSAKYWNKT